MANTIDQFASQELSRLSEEIASELDRRPTLLELLEVLGWGAQSLRDKLADDPPFPIVFAASPPVTGESCAGDLTDSIYAEAGDILEALANELAEGRESKPTLDDLVSLIARGLVFAETNIIEGASCLQGLTVANPARRPRPKSGDIIAIPAANGAYHLAVVVAQDNFGTAFGLFQGTHPAKPISATHHPPVHPIPRYVDDEAIRSGRWPAIGHDNALLAKFRTPELFHTPHEDFPDLGPHGAAETASGNLRPLTKEEAQEVGLTKPSFRQAYLWKRFERLLNEDLKE
ncbi:hypothetical protein [Crossiella sp. CA198]|uniref:hypothetical protein n=1 Tax=Crossiella sp. CA198 TaxID=3455607 RepID=UPI003F8D7DD3